MYTAGITNKIFAASVNGGEKLVFRVFGKNTENFIDRRLELKAMEKLASHHLAAPLYAHFLNGIVVGYLPGRTVSVDDLKDPRMQKRICSTMAAYHKMDGSVSIDSKDLFCFRKLRDFIRTIRMEEVTEQASFVRDVPEELNEMESLVIPLKEDIVFCHNDLLAHNIVFDPLSDHVRFIDFEYADFNYSLFDLANHFCEFAGVDNPDYSRCPSTEEIRSFLRLYLRERYGHFDERRVDELARRTPLFQALAHLLWSTWSVVQSQNSILDFDYVRYATARHEQYLRCLHEYKSQLN